MQIQTFINPNGSHCDVTLFGFIPGYIFCSCLLQNASNSDFWMKFFPSGCNFCSFLWVHQFCCINFRWRVVARDTFSLSILAYWMGYALYSILYLAMFRQQTIFFDIYIYIYIHIYTHTYIYDCNLWKESSCTWSQTYRDQQWINWKHVFFERKYLIMKSTSTISTNYSQDKNTHFLLFLFLFLFLNWNFYFLFVVTLIVVTLRSHFYYTAVRWCNNYPAT